MLNDLSQYNDIKDPVSHARSVDIADNPSDVAPFMFQSRVFKESMIDIEGNHAITQFPQKETHISLSTSKLADPALRYIRKLRRYY